VRLRSGSTGTPPMESTILEDLHRRGKAPDSSSGQTAHEAGDRSATELASIAADRRSRFRMIRLGVENLEAGLVVSRHRHAAGYATIVLAGSFEEASFAGRFIAGPGDVLLHGAFDCHANWITSRCSLKILRLPWCDNLLEGLFRVADPDALARLAERDPIEAMNQLRANLIQIGSAKFHWTERLAYALRVQTFTRLDTWADSERLAPETVSRGFHRAFGVTPKVFRIESRARRAWNLLLRSSSPLTEIAHQMGFADHAHLSRSVVALTGAPPSYWRTRGEVLRI
jgi:AraC-like DNA-binding protein